MTYLIIGFIAGGIVSIAFFLWLFKDFEVYR